MPRGQPDFGMYAVKEVSASISDMGEVAARLGSINIYDKRGDVVEFDSFEDPVLKWLISKTALSDGRLINNNARSGSQSIYLEAGAGVGENVKLDRSVSIVGSKRLGMEISFSRFGHPAAGAKGARFTLEQTRFDGVAAQNVRVKIEHSATGNILYIFNSDEAWQEIINLGVTCDILFLFETIKLVVDYAAGKYVRLLYTTNEYDLSDIEIYSEADDDPPVIKTSIYLENEVANLVRIWIEDWILTQAEP